MLDLSWNDKFLVDSFNSIVELVKSFSSLIENISKDSIFTTKKKIVC